MVNQRCQYKVTFISGVTIHAEHYGPEIVSSSRNWVMNNSALYTSVLIMMNIIYVHMNHGNSHCRIQITVKVKYNYESNIIILSCI